MRPSNESIGHRLRAVRLRKQLTLRDVEAKSSSIAERWGEPNYHMSASWLSRVESGAREFSASKLVVLAVIYELDPDEMLSLRPNPSDALNYPNPDHHSLLDTVSSASPVTEIGEKQWTLNQIIVHPIPDETTLLPAERHLPHYVRKGVMGAKDTALIPMVRPGSLLFVNTLKRNIGTRKDWGNEYERPIYLLFTRSGFSCGWCDLDESGDWVTLIPHHSSPASVRRWKLRSEVEVVGRVTATLLRLNDSL